MTELQKWTYYYSRNWATKEQLQLVVGFGKLTADDYKAITDELYPKATE